MLIIGTNAAEAHPVSMLHMLHAKENRRQDDRRRPALHAHGGQGRQYVRIRSGTDIPFLFGMLYHIFKNGWEDKKYINDRVYGMDKVREEVDQVDARQGRGSLRRDGASSSRRRRDDGKRSPRTIVWCMGQTQHTIGNAIVRASCIAAARARQRRQSGGGANIFRGHDNVQGATDVGPNPDSLPGYYGLAEGSWKHFAASGASTTSGSKKQFDTTADGSMMTKRRA